MKIDIAGQPQPLEHGITGLGDVAQRAGLEIAFVHGVDRAEARPVAAGWRTPSTPGRCSGTRTTFVPHFSGHLSAGIT